MCCSRLPPALTAPGQACWMAALVKASLACRHVKSSSLAAMCILAQTDWLLLPKIVPFHCCHFKHKHVLHVFLYNVMGVGISFVFSLILILAQVLAGQSRAGKGLLYCMCKSALVSCSIKSKLALEACNEPTNQAVARCLACIQGLKALLTTLIISLPAFYNVGALLMLVFFMYSYVAVLLFGSIQPQAAINDHANFSNFGEQARRIPCFPVANSSYHARHDP